MSETTPERQLGSAIEKNDLDEFKRLLEAYPEILRDDSGWLNFTSQMGLLPFVQVLIEKGVDVNAPAIPWGEGAAVVSAAGRGYLDIVRWLLDHGGNVNQKIEGKHCCVALSIAATHGHLDVVKLLVERGADIHASHSGLNALMQAEMYGQVEVAEYLRSIGMQDVRDVTPPDYPASHERIRAIVCDQRGELGAWSTVVPGDPPVSIHGTRPSEKWDSQTVFTVGMSDRKLELPDGEVIVTELSFTLPPDWPLDDEALRDPLLNWPIEWLGRLAREALDKNHWPADEAAVFMNGDPPQPLAANTQLCGWLCLAPSGAQYQMPDYRWVDMRTLFPIYAKEQGLIDASGHEELIRRFEVRNLPLYVDPNRPNVAK